MTDEVFGTLELTSKHGYKESECEKKNAFLVTLIKVKVLGRHGISHG